MSDPATGTVIERLNAVARDLGAIPKRHVDVGSKGYDAFMVDDVYAHVGPLLAKHGVVVMPKFIRVDYGTVTAQSGSSGTTARVVFDYIFHAPDESTLTMTFAAEGTDYQDKATNKAAQQALKYGLIQMFQISTGEVDPDAVELPEQATTPQPEVSMSPDRRARNAAWDLLKPDEAAAETLFLDALNAAEFAVDAELSDKDADLVIEHINRLVQQ